MFNDDRKNAFRDAKSAVSALARDPYDRNAAKVQFAWETVKEQQKTMWQQHSEMWLQSK
jgi:hypothetical protein